MKLMNVKNVDKLFAVIDSCKGKVELVTGEGDRLNLKSKLSRYVPLTQLFLTGPFRRWSWWPMSRRIPKSASIS
jgi:hypothetical protein